MSLGSAFLAPLGVSAAASQMAGSPPADSRPRRSKGELIAGILADALAGMVGQRGPMAAQWGREREQERELAQWGLQRRGRLEDYEAQKQIDRRYDPPDIPPMLRDAQAWAGMTDAQREAFKAMNQAKAGDPDVFVTLPNGQVYSGPKSGLAQALMGGGQAPQKPVGRLTPIQGGQTAPPSGTFRP